MIIMFIFLGLTIVLLICTAIYLNHKKQIIKNEFNNIYKNSHKFQIHSKKQLKDIFDIKIKDNIICLGNRYSHIIKLGNIDYNMLSNEEQDSIENALIQLTLAIDYPIQFFSTTEFIDTSKIISLLKSNKTNSFKINEYKEYLIEYLQNLMDNRNISIVKNYAIISYDGLYKNAIEELNRNSLSFKSNLLRAKITCEILNENELYSLIYSELNKNSTISINIFQKGGQKLYVTKKQKTKRNRHI